MCAYTPMPNITSRMLFICFHMPRELSGLCGLILTESLVLESGRMPGLEAFNTSNYTDLFLEAPSLNYFNCYFHFGLLPQVQISFNLSQAI